MALCAVLKRHNAAYFTHLRDEANHVVAAVEEAIDIARTWGVHVEIVHLKCSGLDNWGKAARILAMIEAARAEGLKIDCDAYPYAAGSNPLKNLLPQWVQSEGMEAMLARLALPETRARIRAEIDRDGLNNWGRIPSWDNVQISISPNLPQHAGETFGALAAARGVDPVDAVCDYLVEDKGATRVLDHLDRRGRHPRDRALAHGLGRLRRQLRRRLRDHQPGNAASALLRHLPAHYRPLRARRASAAARSGGAQDDRGDSGGSAAARPRTAA